MVWHLREGGAYLSPSAYQMKQGTYIVETYYTAVAYNGNKFHAGNYLFKVNNRNIRPRFEICSKLTIKTSDQHQ